MDVEGRFLGIHPCCGQFYSGFVVVVLGGPASTSAKTISRRRDWNSSGVRSLTVILGRIFRRVLLSFVVVDVVVLIASGCVRNDGCSGDECCFGTSDRRRMTFYCRRRPWKGRNPLFRRLRWHYLLPKKRTLRGGFWGFTGVVAGVAALSLFFGRCYFGREVTAMIRE